MKDRLGHNLPEEDETMGFLGILVVTLSFLAAIFTAGYNDRPGTTKKGNR
ncbi:hypothetical protein [Pseudalkalibacillus caeni]|nr:hypothetical protein [Pseudalkalibacillus caeni]